MNKLLQMKKLTLAILFAGAIATGLTAQTLKNKKDFYAKESSLA